MGKLTIFIEPINLITPIVYYNYVIFNFIIRLSLTTIAGGLIGTPGFVGFGSSAPGFLLLEELLILQTLLEL